VQEIFSFTKYPDWLRGQPNLLFNGYQAFFPGAKWLGWVGDHTPTSHLKFGSLWSYTSTPRTCLHGEET